MKWKLLSIVLLLVTTTLPTFLTSTRETSNQTKPSVGMYATGTSYDKQLPEPPPIPIWDEPPEKIMANTTMQDLLSESVGNKTGKIPQKFAIDPKHSLITGRQVEFAEQTSTEGLGTLSHEVIDSDTKSGSKLTLSTVFYKDMGEQDPNWDYYAVKCTIEDDYAKNTFWNGPLYADIWLFFPDWCEEVPANHKPQAGFRLSAGSGAFGYQGIGFSLNFPAYRVSYEKSTTKYPGWLYAHWSYDGAWGPFAYWYYVFDDFTEAAVGVRVPQGEKPYCYAAGWICWYKFWIFVFTKDCTEMVNWCYVDPPEVMEHPEPPVPSTPSTPIEVPGPSQPIQNVCVDGFVYVASFTDATYTELKYITIGGMGQSGYGYHAGEYSFISLLAAVSSNGTPVTNVPVQFYLVDPYGEVYDIGKWYTDDCGIAGCTVGFDPIAGTPQGMWWFIPVYGDTYDECGFSYVYCLLITGYTLMRCWNTVYIEDVYLVAEDNVVSLTAEPFEGYEFKYWWINYYYECYENPIYILVDFDCVVLARYMPLDSDDWEPVCAMKTRADGYFYIPNLATDLLKVEMLFDDTLVGDQTGGTSPYGSISNWPDGKVDLSDLLFIEDGFWKVEGDDDWDYMLDIVPNGKCGLDDLLEVIDHYWGIGTYITDLTGVTVTFNTGETKSPDSYGFVEIPLGGTGFTVKRYGNPIGAMIIFLMKVN